MHNVLGRRLRLRLRREPMPWRLHNVLGRRLRLRLRSVSLQGDLYEL